MCATLAGMPSLSARLKSITRNARLWPPPWCLTVIRPCTFLPPRPCSGRTSDFSGSLRVTSAKSEPLAPRLPGVVGLYLRMPMSAEAPCSSGLALAADVDPLASGQADDRALGVWPLAPELAGLGTDAAPLARPVQRVHAGHLDVEDRLDGLADLRLGGVRGHDERVLVELVLEAVALLRDHRPEQDVSVAVDLAHRCSPSCLPARATNVSNAGLVNTTRSRTRTS